MTLVPPNILGSALFIGNEFKKLYLLSLSEVSQYARQHHAILKQLTFEIPNLILASGNITVSCSQIQSR